MSSIIEDTGESDEELVRKNMQTVLHSQVINRTDPDEQFRKEQKRLREKLAYEKQRKEQVARLEVQEKRQIQIDRKNNEMELRGRGWSRWPQPHEKFYHEGVCDICNSEVMYLDANSPHVTVHDYPNNMPREKIQSGYNYEIKHVCKQITTQYVQRLWDVIADLNQRLSVHDSRSARYTYMPAA